MAPHSRRQYSSRSGDFWGLCLPVSLRSLTVEEERFPVTRVPPLPAALYEFPPTASGSRQLSGVQMFLPRLWAGFPTWRHKYVLLKLNFYIIGRAVIEPGRCPCICHKDTDVQREVLMACLISDL
jgi:hypothetical protein